VFINQPTILAIATSIIYVLPLMLQPLIAAGRGTIFLRARFGSAEVKVNAKFGIADSNRDESKIVQPARVAVSLNQRFDYCCIPGKVQRVYETFVFYVGILLLSRFPIFSALFIFIHNYTAKSLDKNRRIKSKMEFPLVFMLKESKNS